MPVINRRLAGTGKGVTLATCEVCGKPASFIDTSGKAPLAYCGMKDGEFCCVKPDALDEALGDADARRD